MRSFLWFVPMVLLTMACGRPFRIHTPTGFLELDDSHYAYRASTADGVVAAVRVIEEPLAAQRGDLAFWERAVVLRLVRERGYAHLSSSDVRSRDGSPGRELVFGHDEGGKAYVYKVRLFDAQDRLFVLEAGGPKPDVEKTLELSQLMDSLKVRCDTVVSPVLASRTCNRW